jgi:hypothetical protein
MIIRPKGIKSTFNGFVPVIDCRPNRVAVCCQVFAGVVGGHEQNQVIRFVQVKCEKIFVLKLKVNYNIGSLINRSVAPATPLADVARRRALNP